MKKIELYILLLLISGLSISGLSASAQKRQTPIMGWSSWNNYRINISEDMVKSQADAMSSNGMSEVGYQFINIDDGFFSNRDSQGNLQFHKEKFPNGMKHLADYIHSKGLKAGIYAEAGINTCGAEWDKDTYGLGAGSFGYERQDCELLLNSYGFDFLKVDYCGALHMALDEKQQYSKFSSIIREIAPNAIYNVCRWEFPGTWVTEIADSWRISGDIDDNFKSIINIVDKNRFTAPYAGPGHFNDMDMLQVGRGMSKTEDMAHFSLWAIMTSPLLAGNDLATMSSETIEILTNKEVIAINQDSAAIQGRFIKKIGECEIFVKPLGSRYSRTLAVAILNRTNTTQSCNVTWADLGIEGYTKVRDLWAHENLFGGESTVKITVPSHGVNMYKIAGESFSTPTEYEAEYAFIKGFKTTTDVAPLKIFNTIKPTTLPDTYVVKEIGEGEWIEWQDIYVEKSGAYIVSIDSYYGDEVACTLQVNGGGITKSTLKREKRDSKCIITAKLKLRKGINSIKLDTKRGKIINIDKLTITN